MESPPSYLIIFRSLEKVRTLRMEKRTIIILILGGIVFAGALAFFAYEYFSLLYGRSYLMEDVERLKKQISFLEEKFKKAAPQSKVSQLGSSPVAIEGLKVTRRANRGGFSVKFRLVNQHSQKIPLSGTIALVAKNENLRTPVYQVIPEMRLNQGIPQQPERGSQFHLQKEKFIEAYFTSSSGVPFKVLTIYIYSPEGKLLMQKNAEISGE